MKLLPPLSIFIILYVFVPVLRAQEIFLTGSRSQALAGSSVSLADSWSVFGNQAGIADISQPIVGGTFQNRFLVKELSSNFGFFIFPWQSSVFAFSVYQFGKTTFHQEKFGITFSHKLSSRLHFGIQFNYYRFFLPEDNRSIGSSGIELGFQYKLSDQLLLGFHILSPYKASIKTFSGKYTYSSRIRLGTYYQISKYFAFVSEFENNQSNPLKVRTGLEYSILDKLVLRTGVSGKPYELSAGMGFVFERLKIDMAVAYNQFLGNSPSVSFQYQF